MQTLPSTGNIFFLICFANENMKQPSGILWLFFGGFSIAQNGPICPDTRKYKVHLSCLEHSIQCQFKFDFHFLHNVHMSYRKAYAYLLSSQKTNTICNRLTKSFDYVYCATICLQSNISSVFLVQPWGIQNWLDFIIKK